MPTLTVVAGPNGSGKSTLTRLAREGFQDSPVLDPDAIDKIARIVTEENVSAIEAGREVLRRASECLQKRESFLVETTLSGNTYLRMMSEAKELGFLIVLFFIGTAGVEINLERVKLRVLEGGHDVPESDQRRRFPRSMRNLQEAFRLSDEAVLFDNSAETPRRLAVKDAAGVTVYDELPPWAAFLQNT